MPERVIDHLVILMLENRSFDHLFGYRPGVDGLNGTERNLLDPAKPESDINPVFVVDNGAPYAISAGQGPGHSINATNVQLFRQKSAPTSSKATMDGFVLSYRNELLADHVGSPRHDQLQVVMQSFAPERLPAINALADAFCVCDRWHSEVPGPTHPNRLFVHAGTSFGYAHNVWATPFNAPTVYEALQAASATWATYDFDKNEVRAFTRLSGRTDSFRRFTTDFADDVRRGKLPNYAFIVPRMFNQGDQLANDQHPPLDARYGDHLVADVYEALRTNDAVWQRTALIVTYDEHGGFFDHVAPPAAVNPDGRTSPVAGDPSYVPPFGFDRLGLRVPAVIASPWIRQGMVHSQLLQHTSLIATARRLFGFTMPLGKREASAAAFDTLFSALNSPRTDTPMTLPRVPLPRITVGPDDPRHPSNLGLDASQRAVLHQVHVLTGKPGTIAPGLDALPDTQSEASTFIQHRFANAYRRQRRPGRARTRSRPRRK